MRRTEIAVATSPAGGEPWFGCDGRCSCVKTTAESGVSAAKVIGAIARLTLATPTSGPANTEF